MPVSLLFCVLACNSFPAFPLTCIMYAFFSTSLLSYFLHLLHFSYPASPLSCIHSLLHSFLPSCPATCHGLHPRASVLCPVNSPEKWRMGLKFTTKSLKTILRKTKKQKVVIQYLCEKCRRRKFSRKEAHFANFREKNVSENMTL